MRIFVTTSFKPTPYMIERAQSISAKLEVPYLKRGDKSVAEILGETKADTFILVEKNKESIIRQDKKYFFHPSLGKLRVLSLQEGKKDTMVEAMSLGLGDTVLDCTLGLGSDAIVSSFMVGETGIVVGIESSPFISLLVEQGLKTYKDDNKKLISAMRRITVIKEDYEVFLKRQPSKGFDIVYFDPMFRWPVKKSDAISAIRSFANPASISQTAIEEAVRVAKKRVVIKERKNSKEFERLNCTQIYGGKYSPVAYGIIEVDAK